MHVPGIANGTGFGAIKTAHEAADRTQAGQTALCLKLTRRTANTTRPLFCNVNVKLLISLCPPGLQTADAQ